MNGITDKLANLSYPAVLAIMAVLLLARYALRNQDNPLLKSVSEICESLAVAMGLVFLIIRPFIVQSFYIPSPSMHPTLIESDRLLVNKFIYRFREPRKGDIVVFKCPPNADRDHVIKDYIKRVIAVPGDTVRITPPMILLGETQPDPAEVRAAIRYSMELPADAKVKFIKDGAIVDDKKIAASEIAKAMNFTANTKVRITPGEVFLNGKLINEPYIAEDPNSLYPDESNMIGFSQSDIVNDHGNRAVKIPEGRLLVMGDNRNNSNDARFWGLLDRKRILGKAMFIFWPLNRIRWIN